MAMTDTAHGERATPSARPFARLLAFFRVDFPAGRSQPSAWRWALATIVSLAGSIAACGMLVVIATNLFPSTIGYPHFQLADYGKLTVIGVFLACCAWPVVTLASSRARRIFFVLTLAVTIVGFAPDAWILYKGQPVEAVSVLIAMHLVLALITFPALVLIAPQRPLGRPAARTRDTRRTPRSQR